MNHSTKLLRREILVSLCLAVAIPAARAEAISAQGKVYSIAVEGAAYSITTNLGRVTIVPDGGGPTVTLAEGSISVSSLNGGAPGTAAEVMNDPTIAEGVSQAAAMAVRAVVDSGSVGPESGAANAAIELQDTLRVLMQSLPRQAAAAVIESVAKAVPSRSPLLVSAAVKAAIASGMPAVEAGRTLAEAVARGAAGAVSLADVKQLALEITQSAMLAAIGPSLLLGETSAIMTAVTTGTTTGAIQGIVARGASVPAGTEEADTTLQAAYVISQYVVMGADAAVQAQYVGASLESRRALAETAGIAGVVKGAEDAKVRTGILLEKTEVQNAGFQGVNVAVRNPGSPSVPTVTPPSPLDGFGGTTPFTPDDSRRVSPSG